MTVDEIMELVCDRCHWPYVESDQDAMDERCAECEIEKAIRAALSKQAAAFGRAIAESFREVLEKNAAGEYFPKRQ